MFRAPGEHEENRADVALRQGLRDLPVPETSSDFDARVHAALRRPEPWWRALWEQARPVLTTAACSLLVTLALLKGVTATSTAASDLLRPAGAGVIIAYRDSERAEQLDRDIERGDLSAMSLRGLAVLHRPLRLQKMP